MHKFPKPMKTLPLAAGIALGVISAGAAFAQDQLLQTRPPATITVTGHGSVSQAPDMASMSLGVMTQADAAADALKENSAAMEVVIARLKAAGIPDAALQTSGLSVNPNWVSYASSSTQKIEGFTVSNMLQVQIGDLSVLGAVMDAAVGDGANTLNGLSFGIKNPRPALDEARKAAVADARVTAELLATAAGAKLGPLVSINEGGGYGGGVPVFKAASADGVPIQQGEVSTDTSVTVVWQLVE